MARWIGVALFFGLVTARAPCPAPACSLCGGFPFSLKQLTLSQETVRAKVVLLGTLCNAKLNGDPQRPGAGTTDLKIVKVLKYDPVLAGRETVRLNAYIPIVDPKAPPQLLVFCELVDGKIEPYRGKDVKPGTLLEYVEGAMSLAGKDRITSLLYYFRFLNAKDEVVAGDAFLEFARSSDQEVGEVARRLAPAAVRALVQDPKTPPLRLNLFAMMLGACGGPADANLLRGMIDRPNDRTTGALDGLLAGYINLRPKEGWDLAVHVLADKRRPFNQRLAVSRALRFFHNWKPEETKQQILRGLSVMVEDAEVADLAIEDLRQWKMWDLTSRILAQYGRPDFDAPIAKRTIGRYALSCPQPEAQRFVQELRRRDPVLVQEIEEALSFERQPR
jgi:hypothetical protein